VAPRISKSKRARKPELELIRTVVQKHVTTVPVLGDNGWNAHLNTLGV
jgi:hypothetical protein